MRRKTGNGLIVVAAGTGEGLVRWVMVRRVVRMMMMLSVVFVVLFGHFAFLFPVPNGCEREEQVGRALIINENAQAK